MNYEQLAFWSQIAGFVLFVAFIVFAWQKWLAPGVRKSQQEANERIALAERRRDEMRQALSVLEGEVDAAKHDGDAMRKRVEERAAHEKQHTLDEARETGERSIRNAQGELARAREAAAASLRESLADDALDVARTRAQATIDRRLDSKILDEFLASLERGDRG